MAGKLPPDFDAGWYAATYRDVGMSGLSPAQHYLRFGRMLGRRFSPPPPDAPSEPAADRPAERRQAAVFPRVSAPPQPNTGGSPIIDRPEGFDPAEAIVQPAPPRPGRDSDAVVSLEEIAVAPLESAAVAPASQAYARLLRLQVPVGLAQQTPVSCGAGAFRAGPTRIENAWFADHARLRLMLAGGPDPAGAGRLAVHAYQADPASPADLWMLGAGIELPSQGPVFHDLELLHPLMPLLLELAAADGATLAIALLPFPSLLPSGLHSAELKALQNDPNPIDAFWALSELLLQETIGQEGWGDRSVTGVTVNGASSDGDAPLLAQSVQDWLFAVFGLQVDAPHDGGMRLYLPSDCVPTISALASRRLDDGAALSGPYLVAEAGSNRPRWSIALPVDVSPTNAIPVLRHAQSPDGPGVRSAPIHLAIALRSSFAHPRPADDAPQKAIDTPLTVAISASDGDRAEALIGSIRAVVGGEVEFLVDAGYPSDGLRGALDRACGEAWTSLPPCADLREIASTARHETLLTISDCIGLDDARTLSALLELLQRDDSAGSASCALLAETIIKKNAVLQPASGGLFPTGVSFASSPRLSFGEPDVLQSLPGLVYPVAANTLLLTVWRTRALAALPGTSGPVLNTGQDIRLGLDLMAAGYRNWCTTQVTARLSGPYAPRDMIDPVGAAYLQPERWENILGRVAVVRELF